MSKPDTRRTFDGKLVIHGGHFSVEESDKIILEDGCRSEDEHVKEVKHKWATWGRLPEEFIEEDDYTHGWWIVNPEKRKYKHLKKVTCVEKMM